MKVVDGKKDGFYYGEVVQQVSQAGVAGSSVSLALLIIPLDVIYSLKVAYSLKESLSFK